MKEMGYNRKAYDAQETLHGAAHDWLPGRPRAEGIAAAKALLLHNVQGGLQNGRGCRLYKSVVL